MKIEIEIPDDRLAALVKDAGRRMALAGAGVSSDVTLLEAVGVAAASAVLRLRPELAEPDKSINPNTRTRRTEPAEPMIVVEIVNAVGMRMLVKAKPVGPFGVHIDHRPSRAGEWCITHARTGYAVTQGLMTEKGALDLAKSLESMADWDFENPEAIKDWSESRRTRIRKLIDRSVMRSTSAGGKAAKGGERDP